MTSSPDFSTRLLLLNRSIVSSNPSTYPSVLQEILASDHLSLATHDLSFSYDTYSAEDVLARLIPDSADTPWDYEIISHVVLLRLTEKHRPYLPTIGAVFLDKLGKETIAASISDSSPIVISGLNNLEIILKEGLCTFNFNLSQYQWSTKLQSERDRLLRKLSRSDTLLELGGGVGAFTLQAAKIGCEVITSETNSSNYARLVKNAISNRVSTKVHAYSTPPIDLLRSLVQQCDSETVTLKSHDSYFLLKSPPILSLPTRLFTHLLINLPDDVTMEVLTAIYGLYKGKKVADLPFIHCYMNSTSEIPRDDLLRRINQKWRFKLQDLEELKYVTTLQGLKRYYLAFKLPTDVATADIDEVESEGEIEDTQPAKPSDLTDLQQSMAADIAFMQQSMKEGLQPSLLMSHLASFIDTGTTYKRAAESDRGEKRTKE